MRSLLAILVVFLFSNSLIAQVAEKPKPDGDAVVTVRQADEKHFPVINLVFEVHSAAGERIDDATQSEFQVKEDGRLVTITKFQSPISREIRPTSVVLVLDHSSSMAHEDRIGGMKRAVSAFLENQPQGSRVAVIAFGSEVELICPFTSDPKKVRDAVSELLPSGSTRYYDAVDAALKLLSDESGRRAVLAMTDGVDKGSFQADLNSVTKSAIRAGLPIHTLALGSEEEIETEKLRQLAERTRGRAFRAIDADALRGMFEEIAVSLAKTYSLTYTTDYRIQDGTLRPIEVFYSKSTKAGKSAVYVPGMVVPAAGWSWLFLAVVAMLVGLASLPNFFRT